MSINSVSTAILTCHPATPCPAVRRVEVDVRLGVEGKLALAYRLDGDIDALRIPDAGPVQRADGLWQTTCFEVVVTVLPQTGPALNTESALAGGYYEFNFSPSTAWAAYAFTGYRQGMVAVDLVEPVNLTVLRDADWLELAVNINLGDLPLAKESTLLLGLSAVVQAQHGGLSYWAIAHPEGKPDFHHPGSFVFKLA